jgi:hypothetical protein
MALDVVAMSPRTPRVLRVSFGLNWCTFAKMRRRLNFLSVLSARAPLASAFGLLLVVGCGTPDADGDEDGNDEGPMADSDSEGGTLDPDPTATSGTAGTDDGMETEGAETTGFSFVIPEDNGGINNMCDIWAQDCPMGEKCMPWANDGGSSWNATKCTPLDANPGEPGDECTTDGGGVSGVDTCAVSSMCWDLDIETGVGTCVPFCMGTEDAPFCDDPDNACSITNEGVLILCLPTCDPLLQDCGDGQACYPEINGFICSPDASGEQGAIGDGCEYLNVCDPGGACYTADAWPGGCGGSSGCCIPFCDLTDPTCPMGTQCEAVYEDPMPGEEDFGVCAAPL